MKKLFQKISGTVSRLDSEGRGIVEADGKEIRVQFAIPGDQVEATLVKRRKGELFGRVDTITAPSPDRTEPPCPYVGTCGGCPLQMMGYEAQQKWKTAVVSEAFKNAGIEIQIPEAIGARELFWHRNRMDYVISENEGGEVALGLKEPGRWWKTLDLKTCLMLSKDAVECMERVRLWMKKNGVAAWNPKTQSGNARYLVIREGKFTGERMAILVTHEDMLPDPEGLVAALSPLATTIYHAVNPKITDLSIGERYNLLYGKPLLTEEIGGIRYAIPPAAFFQTNSGGAGMLADIVREFADLRGNETVLDLYCGVGFFALQLARNAKRVLGIELEPSAIEAAKENASANGITNAEFRAEKAEDLHWQEERPDIVILDPPRSGLHPKVLETVLKEKPPRIVYVSCNYRALVKELPLLLPHYDVTAIKLLDMFPHTPHVETIVRLDALH